MKKNYFLILLFFTSYLSFAQVIVSEGFSYADGSLVPNGGWAREGGTSGDFQIVSGEAVVQHGTPSEDVKLAFSPVSGAVYVGFDFSVDDLGAVYSGTDNEYFAHLDFKARMDIVPPTAAGDYSVGIASGSSTAEATWGSDLIFGTKYRAIIKFDQDTGAATLWINPTSSSDSSISGSDSGAFSVKEFELRQSDSSENETVRVDNLMIGQTFGDVVSFVANTQPALSVSGITDNQVFNPETTEVSVNVSVSNFNLSADNGSGLSDSSGDGYIKTTFEVAGGTTEVSNFFSTTLPNIQVAAGESYTLTMELVDNAGASLSPEVKATEMFSVASFTDVADIAALRAGTEGDYYKITGEVVVTYTTSNRNQKYIQDASGAILIDDTADVLAPSNYVVGDGSTNLNGRLSSFSGVLQFVPVSNSATKSSTGNTVTKTSVTLSELNSNLDNYESEMITISDVTFTDGDGTAVFTASTNYDLSQGTDMLVFRTNFGDADFIGDVIPSSPVNITGIASEFNGTAQIFGTSAANITLDVARNAILGFATYPNPITNHQFTVTTGNNSKKEIAIYNLLGKQVLSTSFNGTKATIDVANVTAGIYILKVTENDKTATRKLVIK